MADYTHVFCTLCPACLGINAASVDDGSESLTVTLGQWVRDGRMIQRKELPCQLTCTCPPPQPRYTVFNFTESEDAS